MELDTFIQIGLPVSLALIMLSMGMMLKTADFTRVLEQPRALMVGLTAQLILVPMIAVALLFIFNLPPLLAVGLLVLSFSPGGTTSNLFSYLARGDVALSVALTAIASLITPFTIPLLTELALQMQLGENKEIIVPIGLTMKRLFIVTLLPVLIGMSLRIFKPAVADTIQPYIHKISVVLFLAVISSIIIQQWDKMPDFLNQVGTITSLMIVIAMLLGYYIAKLSGLRNREVKTLSIEVVVEMKSLQQYSLIKALRPFSLVVAIISCGLGILIAWNDGYELVHIAFWVMLGGIFAQAGINLINDIEDLPTLPSNHPHLEEVNKMVGRNTKVGIVCFIIASLIGLYLISVHLRNDQGWSLFFLIVVSGIISLSYNMGPLNFKHRGLAMVQVFLLMGIMMIQGAYLAMSGHFSAQVLLHSIPISILISLLLLSNELRDWESDKSKDVGTLTVRIGYQNAVRLYWFLIVLSYLLAIIFFLFGELHQLLWLLIPLPLLIPVRRYLKASERIQLTPMTGRFFFLFGGAPEPEDLDLPHNETVLLTIDIQNTYLEVSDDPVERERWAFFQKRMRELVIPNIQNLQNKFRNQDMDVIHARIACMLTDVRSLADESFNVVVVEDCCAAGTDELHRKELEIINMIYCNVVTTDELVEMMAL
ncbi:putative sodium-dependent transporter YocS [Nymphon striatum]|nr:putative sodium-dependent transporter YocS [Nymphon striatum]